MLENPRNSLVPHIIASGASYVYNFNEQNFIKTLYPDRSILMVQKLVEYAKIKKWDILGTFQTMWSPAELRSVQ